MDKEDDLKLIKPIQQQSKVAGDLALTLYFLNQMRCHVLSYREDLPFDLASRLSAQHDYATKETGTFRATSSFRLLKESRPTILMLPVPRPNTVFVQYQNTTPNHPTCCIYHTRYFVNTVYVKLSLCLTKQNAMKTYLGAEIYSSAHS
jgi:hypothetical protein